jgi:Na+/H+ antiporter NhaD/arsenite permease-like protein
MILASFQRMDFNDFFFYQGRPSLFFAVQVGAVASLFVLWRLFRHHHQAVAEIEPEPVVSLVPTWSLLLLIVLLALSPIVDPGFEWLGGTICMTLGVLLVFWDERRVRGRASLLVRRYDWNTTFFLIGVFVLVEAMVSVGLIDDLARGFTRFTGDHPLVIFVSLVAMSVLLSAFVDNIPYITTMIPVVQEVARGVGLNEVPFIFGMVLGASLGGNITPFGASANVVAVGILRKGGTTVSTRDFVRIGLPFTLVATAAGAAFVWFVWF